MNMINILIVEDDIHIQKLMSIRLQKEGFSTLTADNGEQAIEVLMKHKVQLMLVDIMMPVMNGIDLLRYLKSNSFSVPVIMTTVKESIEDKKTCFDLGADDYLIKPIDREELVLRIRAVLKRCNVLDATVLQIQDVTLDYNRLTVADGKNQITMPKKEFEILFRLLSSPHKVFTKNELMDELWGYDSDSFNDTVKVHVNRIRSKIEIFPQIGIRTIRGVGYKGEIYEEK